jgi:phosphatidylserine/phosphatidylglycerophosphate/cardiolipin synthase-like enzyme
MARRKRKKTVKVVRKRRRIWPIFVFIFIVIALGFAWYFYQGGSVDELTEWAKDRKENPGKLARDLQEATEWTRDQAQYGIETLWSWYREETAPLEIDDGSIQVYFAPVPESRDDGIDDKLIAFLGGAKESIIAAFYDLEYQPVADALIERHAAGVDVQLVTDSHYRDRDALEACLAAGIPITFDEREAFMHNKFAVVDDAYVWTGSTNITYNGLFKNNNNAVLITSRVLAKNYTVEFNELFEGEFGGRSPKRTPRHRLELDNVLIECYFAPEDRAQVQILDEIEDAETSIDVMAFAFTALPIAEAMADRIDDGVKVRALFETRNAGSKYSRDDWLKDRGAEVYLDSNPNTMHHKVIVIDTDTVVTGSYNFSKSAERDNDENVLILHDSAVAQAFTTEFERLID